MPKPGQREISYKRLAIISFCVCALSFVLLFLLSDAKKASDMAAYGSAYTEAWRYIFGYPLIVLLLVGIALLITGILLLVRGKDRI